MFMRAKLKPENYAVANIFTGFHFEIINFTTKPIIEIIYGITECR